MKIKTYPIVQLGRPVLRRKAKKVSRNFVESKKFPALVRALRATMKKAEGIGLAAPQIGLSLQLAVIQIGPTRSRKNPGSFPQTVIINPRIISYGSKKGKSMEGCLSFPQVRACAIRSNKIAVEFRDETFKKKIMKLRGLPAIVFQHEIDHLNGIIYIDRVKDTKTFMSIGTKT